MTTTILPSITPLEAAFQSVLLTDLAPAQFNQRHNIANQIASYLAHLLSKAKISKCRLQVPSVVELSKFFQCETLEVFEGLSEFKRAGYLYEMYGLDGPIQLRQ